MTNGIAESRTNMNYLSPSRTPPEQRLRKGPECCSRASERNKLNLWPNRGFGNHLAFQNTISHPLATPSTAPRADLRSQQVFGAGWRRSSDSSDSSSVMSGITACIPARIDPRPAIRSSQLPRQLSELCPLVVFAGGMAGLADRHAQGSEVEHDLGNQRRTVTGGVLDRAPQCLAVADQLIETRRTTRDLGDRPVTDRSAQAATSTCGKKYRKAESDGGPSSSRPSASVNTLWWRMANRSRSRRLWQRLRFPSTATSSRYQAGIRTPRRIRASGIALK